MQNEPDKFMSRPGDRRLSRATGVALFTILVFIAGLLLLLVTRAVEQANIRGDGWALTGNGALIVPICGFPLILLLGCALLARQLWPSLLSWLGGFALGILTLLLAAGLSARMSWLLLPLALVLACTGVVLLGGLGGSRSRLAWWLAVGLLLPTAAYLGFLAGLFLFWLR